MLKKARVETHSKHQQFESCRNAAIAAIHRVNPDLYARTRNFLDGAVTGLSPWITHGYTNTHEVCKVLHEKTPLGFDDKIIFELAWREFFKHVHGELGSGILEDIRRPVWAGRYQHQLPDDILEARTGVAAVDEGVRQLYETGYLHNHMRMWIASYTVHIRKVNWRVGADWMYAHLLDGDLASNHLSWQWVAGTFSHKPYVFNAENVSKYARHLDCKSTAIDTSYEDLEATARSRRDLGPEKIRPAVGVQRPVCRGFEADLMQKFGDARILDLRLAEDAAAALASVKGIKNIRLIHPWDLAATQAPLGSNENRIGLLELAFHEKHAWSEARWHFVGEALARCKTIWIVDSRDCSKDSSLIDSFKAEEIRFDMLETLNPGYVQVPRCMPIRWLNEPRILPNPNRFQQSFSRFYREAAAIAGNLDQALLRF
ncbi:MAG TPA: FAD-binding domain-containing protein [Limnobacter sp.]|nr:FAD-binding domain-containing protein [Limnobacter sp.]